MFRDQGFGDQSTETTCQHGNTAFGEWNDISRFLARAVCRIEGFAHESEGWNRAFFRSSMSDGFSMNSCQLTL